MSNINVKYKRQFYFSHDSISFESCWDPDINVGSLCLGGDRSKQIVFVDSDYTDEKYA